MNIFEGSRRIATATAVIWVAGFAIAAFNVEGTAYARYKVITVNGSAHLQSKSTCADEDAFEWTTPDFKTPNGTNVDISLCFEAKDWFTNKDGAKLRLVPYKSDPVTQKIWGDDKYSTNVSNYTKEYARQFVVPAADYAKLDQLGRAAWWSSIKEGALWMIGGLVFLYLLTVTLGWVVRGFMGIPKGQDSKQ
jgi:hypothetical protein